MYFDAHWNVLEIFLGILSTTSSGCEHYQQQQQQQQQLMGKKNK